MLYMCISTCIQKHTWTNIGKVISEICIFFLRIKRLQGTLMLLTWIWSLGIKIHEDLSTELMQTLFARNTWWHCKLAKMKAAQESSSWCYFIPPECQTSCLSPIWSYIQSVILRYLVKVFSWAQGMCLFFCFPDTRRPRIWNDSRLPTKFCVYSNIRCLLFHMTCSEI